MKLNKKSKLLTVFLLVMLLTTGCTKTLTNKDGKAVKNPVTGQSLTKNILCQPSDEETIKLYKDNDINIEKVFDKEKLSEFIKDCDYDFYARLLLFYNLRLRYSLCLSLFYL